MRSEERDAEDMHGNPVKLRFWYESWPEQLRNRWPGQTADYLHHMEILRDGNWEKFP
jgi:hypothetical protein